MSITWLGHYTILQNDTGGEPRKSAHSSCYQFMLSPAVSHSSSFSASFPSASVFFIVIVFNSQPTRLKVLSYDFNLQLPNRILRIFSCVYWLSVCLWWNAYSNSLSIFELFICLAKNVKALKWSYESIFPCSVGGWVLYTGELYWAHSSRRASAWLWWGPSGNTTTWQMAGACGRGRDHTAKWEASRIQEPGLLSQELNHSSRSAFSDFLGGIPDPITVQ